MKRLVLSAAALGLALVLQGCAVYAPPYGYSPAYYAYGPSYGITFAYRPYGYYGYYGYRPYGYYRRGPRYFGWGGGYGRHWHH